MVVLPGSEVDSFSKVGGGAYLASEMLALKAAVPHSLILDAGDISEGNPLGDLRGNGGMIDFMNMLDAKLKTIGGRGIDASVVGNHDYRDTVYINNLKRATYPVLSINLCYKNTKTPVFKPYIIDTINGLKIGIIGFTKVESTIGLPSDNVITLRNCTWSGSDTSVIHLRDTVALLRNSYHCNIVILISHETQSRLYSNASDALIIDDGAIKPPEVVISGHWHSWTSTVWRPAFLHGKTVVAEAASYMEYIGEVNVDSTGKYTGAKKHAILCDSITPDTDVQALISNLKAEYDAKQPPHALFDTIGFTASDLCIDQKSRWWSIDEYPWYGDGTAGEWVCDALSWLAIRNGFSCDLAIQTGGGIRKDIPKGPITYMDLYEVYPWQDNMIELKMNGKQVRDYLQEQSLNAAISSGWQVYATDGLIDSVIYKGEKIDTNRQYNIAISDFMYENYNGTWPGILVSRTTKSIVNGIIDYTTQFTEANPMQVSGPRYYSNNRLGGEFDAVVTMMADSESQPSFEAGFVRLLHATDETVSHFGEITPASLINKDGSLNRAHQMCESMWYRSGYGFNQKQFVPGTIVRLRFKGGFYLGTPELCEEEGVYKPDSDFQIIGFDSTLARPAYMSDINSFWNGKMINHLVRFYAVKTGTSTVRDSKGQVITIYQSGGYYTKTLPGSNGDMIELTGVQTFKSGNRLFRCAVARRTTGGYPVGWPPSSFITAIPSYDQTALTFMLHAVASDPHSNIYSLFVNPIADAYTVQGNPTKNNGTVTSMYLQKTGGTYHEERPYCKFSLASLPADIQINAARLNMYAWKATPAISTSCYSVANTWTETGINWNNQPALNQIQDSLIHNDIGWYSWNTFPFVSQKHTGDSVSFAIVATEGSGSYTFDSREYSTVGMRPYLQVDYSEGQDISGIISVAFWYRYSIDNTNWSNWTLAGSVSSTPFDLAFNYPQGKGYYQFYSIATDKEGNVEPAPIDADAFSHFTGTATAASVLVTANGSAEDINLNRQETLNIGIGVNAYDWIGSNGDFWLYCDAANGQRYYFYSNDWHNGTPATFMQSPIWQGDSALCSLTNLPSGAYRFYFGLDNVMDGIPDSDMVIDTINVTINRIPFTLIKANGSSADITLKAGTPIKFDVTLYPNSLSNRNCDLWLVYKTQDNKTFYFKNKNWKWSEEVGTVRQESAVVYESKEVTTIIGLTSGVYTFYFGIDGTVNGALDNTVYYDGIRVTVQ
jgi:2',3'-cyclic-nucleotide 2'-phosphodiesterase (5'-nucleotidase family)